MTSPNAVDKSSGVTLARVDCTSESAILETFLSNTTGLNTQADALSHRVNLSGVLPNGAYTALMPSSHGEHDFRDRSGCGTLCFCSFRPKI